MNLIDEKIRIKKISNALRIFDAFYKFEYFQDEELWNNILSWLERRKGWIRTDIIERIYPLTGTFPKAKEMFDAYYAEVEIIVCSCQLILILSGVTIWNSSDCILLRR